MDATNSVPFGTASLPIKYIPVYNEVDVTFKVTNGFLLEVTLYYIPLDVLGKVFKQLSLKDVNFIDKEFHYENPKILGDNEFIKGIPLAKWDRIGSFCRRKKVEPSLFLGGIEPGDIKQGAIGDCYFLAALAVLANQPKLVSKLFQPYHYNLHGAYLMKLFMKGKWVNIIVDDFLPLKKDDTPLFARSISVNETWVALIEKAYAKYHGSYRNIVAGSIREAMEQLTGGHGMIVNIFADERYTSKDPVEDKKKKDLLFDDLLKWNSTLSLLATSAENGLAFVGDFNPNDKGIVPNHAYSILNVKKVQGNRLLKLRNTWGRFEWSGDWCDEDEENWTPSMKKRLNFQNSDDGQFWMCFEDYLEQFKYLYVCRVPPDCDTIKLESEWKGETAGGHIRIATTFCDNPQFKLTVPKIGPTRVFIELQLHNLPDESDESKLSGVGLYVFKSEGDRPLRTIPKEGSIAQSPFKKLFRDSVEVTLYPSETPYIIIPSHFYAGREDKFTLTLYTTRDCVFEQFKKEESQSKVVTGKWKGDGNFGAHWNMETFKKNPSYLLKVQSKTDVNLVVKVPNKSVPFFPYIVKGSSKEKFDGSKYLKEPMFALYPKGGKEFFNVDAVFNFCLDETESPYVLVMSTPISIPSSEFTISFKASGPLEIVDHLQ